MKLDGKNDSVISKLSNIVHITAVVDPVKKSPGSNGLFIIITNAIIFIFIIIIAIIITIIIIIINIIIIIIFIIIILTFLFCFY